MPQLLPQLLPAPRYARFAALTALLAGLVLLGLPYVLHLFTDTPGGFTVEQLNSFALGAAVFWLTLQMAFLAYRAFFKRFKNYQAECLEAEGKLFENITGPLNDELLRLRDLSNLTLPVACYLAENRKIATLQFIIRCVRLLFCLSALAYLLHLAQWAVTVGLGLRPGGLL